jgi:nitric oxide reductase NorD protein
MSLRDRIARRIDRARKQLLPEGDVPPWARDLGPGLHLLRSDPAALRAWYRYRAAIREGIGEAEAEAYGRLVATVARKDGELARIVAVTIPDNLARVPASRRAVYFSLLEAAAATQPESLGLLARTLPDRVDEFDDERLRAFVKQGVELHAVSHHRAESFLRRESDAARLAVEALHSGVALADVSRVLTLYARAHCGDDVQVRPGKGRAFSDGHHVYLPERMDRFGDERDFALLRVLTAMGAGYLEFGTFDLDLATLPEPAGGWPSPREGESELERWFRSFSNKSLAREVFQLLEDARVEARISEEYPGIARDIAAVGPTMRGKRPEPTAPAARAVESLARELWRLEALPLDVPADAAIAPLRSLRGELTSLDVNAIARAVQAHYPAVEALMLRAADGKPPRSQGSERIRMPGGNDAQAETAFQPQELGARIDPEAAGSEERRMEAEARRLRESAAERGENLSMAEARERRREAERRQQMLADATAFTQMEAMLERQELTGGALVDPSQAPESNVPAVAKGLPQDPDVAATGRNYVYREWDASIGDYKPRWVVVREARLREGERAFVDEVMERERHHIDRLRRTFEALRPQGRALVRGLTDGDELDIDRVVQSVVEGRVTGQRGDRLYVRALPERRDVAAAFLLDMSSSTNEATAAGGKRRVIDVEKEALILVAEALSAIGDPFAIYGFSGYGRDHVAFYVAKDFRDGWDDRARERVGRMSFKMENRDGAAIRHASRKLAAMPARSRILFLLSDGKPLDCGCDHYYDRYAQEDTRMALTEARALGVRPFCITVDPTGPAYLKRMYGDVGYCVIDRVDALPAQIVAVYRRLAL